LEQEDFNPKLWHAINYTIKLFFDRERTNGGNNNGYKGGG